MVFAMCEPREIGPSITDVVESCADGVRLRIKAVPGSSRDKVVGMLGDRLKIAVAAAPEGGKANRAIRELLSRQFNVPTRDVHVVEGKTRPQKVIQIDGLSLCAAAEALGEVLAL